MNNKEIARLLRLASDLMELNDENPFKIRAFQNAALYVERLETKIYQLSDEDLANLDGVGKNISQALKDIRNTGSFPVLEALLDTTPRGVVKMIDIKGIGPKKLRALWKEYGIESPEQLREACLRGDIAKLKGFGQKTQKRLLETLEFLHAHSGKALYIDADLEAQRLERELGEAFRGLLIGRTGELRRQMETVSCIELLLGWPDSEHIHAFLDKHKRLSKNEAESGLFVWRGFTGEDQHRLTFRICTPDMFYNKLLLFTGSEQHLCNSRKDELSLFHLAYGPSLESEMRAYESLNMSFVPPELREGTWEIGAAQEGTLPKLIEASDIRGSFHNHSTYSDGKNSVTAMARRCIELGYQYLGISDHSQSAYYAGGLDEARIATQHLEIEQLNRDLKPFRIFKGIESDILSDGSLDYSDDVLASFDFVVASIHSNLDMDSSTSTRRLLKAIENPYTTFLGHPTGRLLLRRGGYPVDLRAVLKACAHYKVIVEINANPWRLDLDWRWISEGLEYGVLLSINPDAHDTEGLEHMRYGLCAARKGGLEKDECFNAWPLDRVEEYLRARKN